MISGENIPYGPPLFDTLSFSSFRMLVYSRMR